VVLKRSNAVHLGEMNEIDRCNGMILIHQFW